MGKKVLYMNHRGAGKSTANKAAMALHGEKPSFLEWLFLKIIGPIKVRVKVKFKKGAPMAYKKHRKNMIMGKIIEHELNKDVQRKNLMDLYKFCSKEVDPMISVKLLKEWINDGTLNILSQFKDPEKLTPWHPTPMDLMMEDAMKKGIGITRIDPRKWWNEPMIRYMRCNNTRLTKNCLRNMVACGAVR